MNRQYIDDHHIVARYLADQLADDEREAFEAYYLEHPEVVQEIEAAARFKAGLMHLQESGEIDRLINAKLPYRRWKFLSAAAAIAAIAFGVAFFANREPRTPLLATTLAALGPEVGTPTMLASTHQIVRMRNAQDIDATVELPVPAGAIELQVLPEYASSLYRIVLSRVENDRKQEIALIDSASTDQDGFVSLYLNSARIEPGRYELEVANAASQNGATSVFTLQVRGAN